jgi:hypothetical protein
MMLGVAGLAATAAVLGSPGGAFAAPEQARATAASRIVYLQRDVPGPFESTLASIAFNGSGRSGIISGPGLHTAAMSQDRQRLGMEAMSLMQILDPTPGSEHMVNAAASDSALSMAFTPTTNVLVAETSFDGVEPKVVSLGPDEEDTLTTLLDHEDFLASSFFVLGTDDDRALVQSNADQREILTVLLDGSGFKVWSDWAGAWQAPRNGPIFALDLVDGEYQLLRLGHGQTDTTLVTELPTGDVHGGSWSARGNKFVLVARWGGKDRLVVVNRAGTRVTVLSRQPAADLGFVFPTLSANGSLLAYTVKLDGNRRTAGLWVRDLARERSCRLVPWSKAPDPRAAFAPNGARIVVSSVRHIAGSVKITRPGGRLGGVSLPESELIGFVGGSDKQVNARPC